MMVISSLNYEADEFLESCAGSVPTDTLWQLINNAAEFRSDAHLHTIVSRYNSAFGQVRHVYLNSPMPPGSERLGPRFGDA